MQFFRKFTRAACQLKYSHSALSFTVLWKTVGWLWSLSVHLVDTRLVSRCQILSLVPNNPLLGWTCCFYNLMQNLRTLFIVKPRMLLALCLPGLFLLSSQLPQTCAGTWGYCSLRMKLSIFIFWTSCQPISQTCQDPSE